MSEVERFVIPRCIGCGAMHEFERCDGGCSEEHLELVAAGDLDALAIAWRSERARIDALLDAVRGLVGSEPAPDQVQLAYRTRARAARAALRGAPAAPVWPAPLGDPGGPLQIDVWRCTRCGAVDAPQECLGICIWRRFEWVRSDDWRALSARAEAARTLERRLSGLLLRLAFTTPRAGAWQRGWRALSAEAAELLAADAEAAELLAAGTEPTVHGVTLV